MSEEQVAVPAEVVAAPLDIDALSAVVNVVAQGVAAGLAVAQDGKVDWSDMSVIMGVAPSLVSALSKLGELPAEVSKLSPEAVAQLVAELDAGIPLSDAKAQAIVKASLKMVEGGADLVLALAM